MTGLSSLTFAEPARLALLLAVVALAVGAAVLALRRDAVRAAWADPATWSSSLPRGTGWRRAVTTALLLAGLATSVVAWARPQVLAPQARERSAVVLTLDTSTSMLADDVAPTRFAAAVAAAREFVQGLPEHVDVALVAYNANVRLVQPLTRDHELLARALEGLPLSGGTALGDAVATGLAALPPELREPGPPGGPPAARIVVLSDGGSTTGRPVADAAALARTAGVPVSTIAYGTPDGVVVSGGTTFPVPVDAVLLEQLAEATEGTAYRAESADQLQQVYDDIGSRVTRDTARRELAAPVAGVALALLLGTGVVGLLTTGRVG